MKIIVTKDYNQSCELVAEQIVNLINENPKIKLGLATGGTAEKMYSHIVKAYQQGKVDFSEVSTVNLDEYVGVSPENPVSYRYYMNHWLFDNINIDKANTYVANGLADPTEELKNFNHALYGNGNVNLQLLGVGVSGHIGFNESSDSLTAGAHIEDLDESTINANSRYFDSEDDVPKQAYTMGVGDILKAEKILIFATGDNKADVIKELLCNDQIKTTVPVTMLKVHRDVTVVIDQQLADKCGYKA